MAQLTNLQQRILSAAILAPLALGIIYHGGFPMIIMMLVLAVLMSFEWYGLVHSKAVDTSEKVRLRWQMAGIFYVALPCASLLWLRQLDKGLLIVCWMLGVVWATDIMAYFVGRTVGGPKLAPTISPNKTWSGLCGGVVAAGVIGGIVGITASSPSPLALVGISAGLAVIAQAGDLFESGLKRYFGVKDSGQLIPGHGGILDRVDGIVTVAPKVALLMLIEANIF